MEVTTLSAYVRFVGPWWGFFFIISGEINRFIMGFVDPWWGFLFIISGEINRFIM
jgi:hypothetical protein